MKLQQRVVDIARAPELEPSQLRKWIRQCLAEIQGITPVSTALIPELRRIQELEKQVRRLEMEKEILKQAVVDSIGQRNSHVKTCSCGGLLDETVIYSKGKSFCF